MEAYADAGEVFASKIEGKQRLGPGGKIGSRFVPKYSLPISDTWSRAARRDVPAIPIDDALRLIWSNASERVTDAETHLGE